MKSKGVFCFSFYLFCLLFYFQSAYSLDQQSLPNNNSLDDKVKNFLATHQYDWQDMNIAEADGQALFNLIIKHQYTRGLDIGTSTGRSAIWMAWALSKTGGKLITIEINKDRYQKALANFKQAGLTEYVDARLADAHDLVRELKGPFDFVFCDADKDWYKNYLISIWPKLKVGGCFAAHNVKKNDPWSQVGIDEFIAYIESQPNIETHFIEPRREGISITYKKSD